MGEAKANISLPDITGTGVGTAFEMPRGRNLNMATLQVSGTFNLRFDIEISLDGTNWALYVDQMGSELENINDEMCTILTGDVVWIRTNCTLYVSGTASVVIHPLQN